MINFVMSLLLGMLPEVLFVTFFLILTKNIKEKKLKLFSLLMVGYVLLIMICRFQLLFYVLYIAYTYICLKILYKSHIIDVFVCSLAYAYLTVCSLVGFKVTSNYYVGYLIHLIMLYAIFIFKNKFNFLYTNYKKLWNRNDKQKIKSLTLRNISLLIVNIVIVLVNVLLLIAIKYYNGLG